MNYSMLCTIRWTKSTPTIWKKYFQKVNNSNLLQSCDYGEGMRAIAGQQPEFGIIEIDGQEAGLFQMLKNQAVLEILQVLAIDRGPLWFDGFGAPQHFEGFLQALLSQYPRRFGRVMRIMPEYEETTEIDSILQKYKFRKKADGYQTYLLNLTQSEEILHRNLKKNWRASLKKSEKSGIYMDWDTKGQYLNWLLKMYNFDKKTKGYAGPSVKFLTTMAESFAKNENMILGRVMRENKAIAAILLFCHGRSCTYQIGWNTQDGRAISAHNFALWQAVLLLKSKGYKSFDLGGVNDKKAQNVKKFKQGMGGDFIALAGLYN